jgi:hypothetical protein
MQIFLLSCPPLSHMFILTSRSLAQARGLKQVIVHYYRNTAGSQCLWIQAVGLGWVLITQKTTLMLRTRWLHGWALPPQPRVMTNGMRGRWGSLSRLSPRVNVPYTPFQHDDTWNVATRTEHDEPHNWWTGLPLGTLSCSRGGSC